MYFKDREDAGRQLAQKLEQYRDEKPFVIGLPRGGVVVAYEVAKALKAPLDVMVARKLGAPGQPELGIGAIAPNGVRVLNTLLIQQLRVSPEALEAVTAQEIREMERRIKVYRDELPPPDIGGRTVILVDDGLATGYSAWAAVKALRYLRPKALVLAVPVAAPDSLELLRPEVDDMVCLFAPQDFLGVGVWYQWFGQTPDREVIDLLRLAREEAHVG